MQRAVPPKVLGFLAKFAHGLRGPSIVRGWEALGPKEFPSRSAFACTMQRRRPGGLNPTLLDGSPRNAAGEYAACMGLGDDVDAQAAMRADGLAWKERGSRTFCRHAVPRTACWARPLLGVRKGSPRRAGGTTHDSGLGCRVAVLLQQAGGPLSAQAALARGSKLFCSTRVSMLLGSAVCSLMRDMRGLGHVLGSWRWGVLGSNRNNNSILVMGIAIVMVMVMEILLVITIIIVRVIVFHMPGCIFALAGGYTPSRPVQARPA